MKTFKEHEQLIIAKHAELLVLFRDAEKDGYLINFGVQFVNGVPGYQLGLGILPKPQDPPHAD